MPRTLTFGLSYSKIVKNKPFKDERASTKRAPCGLFMQKKRAQPSSIWMKFRQLSKEA